MIRMGRGVRVVVAIGVLALQVLSGSALLAINATNAVAGDGTLLVGHTNDYEPLNFMRDGKLAGIEVDNAREVAKLLGMKTESVVMPFAELFPALQSGKIDVVMAGVSVTPERSEQVLFIEPFMQVGQMAIILSDEAVNFAHPRSAFRDGVRIGVEPSTTGDRYARDKLVRAKIKYYEDSQAAFQALRAREIDMYIHDAPTSWRLAITRENQDLLGLFRPLTQEHLAWAVASDNTVLAARLNAALLQLEESGRLRAIKNYWIPVTIQVR